MATRFLVIATSLNPESRSAILATEAVSTLDRRGLPFEVIDLRDDALPICDGGEAYEHPRVKALVDAVAAADVVLIAAPIYNYDVSAAAKNVVELAGRSLQEKVVGLLCAAGGQGSLMSPMGLASSLMLDFRCIVTPRFVYATGDDFEGDSIVNEIVQRRVAELILASERLARGQRLALEDERSGRG